MKLGQLIDQFELVTDTEEGLEQLRKVILNLAVRGGLTKKKNPDKDAFRLVKKANEEKQQLYEDGEIRKPKEFDDVTDDEVSFQIPEHWEWCRLCDISIIETGKRMKGGARDEGVISLGGEHLNSDGTIDYSIPRCITEEFYDQLNRGQIEVGDILIVKDGATTGKTAFVRKLPESGKAAINEHVVLVRALSTVDKNFLFRFIQILSEEFAKKHSKGVIGGVKMSQLRSFPVPLPPLEEQQRIVQKIENLFSQVDELEQKVQQDREVDEHLHAAVLDDVQRAETPEASRHSWQRITDHFEQIYRKSEHINQLKQAILNEAVRGRLVSQDPNDEPAEKLLERIKEEKQRLYEEGEIRKPKELDPISDEEVPYQIPKGWCWERLGNLVILERGRSKHRPRNADKLFNNGKYPFIQTGDVANSNGQITEYSKKYNEVGLKQSKLWSKGTLCITIAANIADTGILGIDACFPDSIVGLLPVIRPDETVKYYDYFIQNLQSDLEEFAPSTAQKNINLTILNSLLCPLPPLEEQVRIVKKVRKLFTWCDNLKEKLNRSQQTDQRLLEALVKGPLEDKVEKEPEATKETPVYKLPQSRKKESKITKLPGISTTDVQAGIIAKVIKAHEGNLKYKGKLGHVKAEKICHLAESHIGIELDREPQRLAAGPADFTRLKKVEHRGRMTGWFSTIDKKIGHSYRSGRNMHQIIDKVNKKLGPKSEQVDELIDLFLPMDKLRSEVVATLYAAWNDLLAEGKQPTDDEIVKEASTAENWAPEKEKIEEKNFYKALKWMRKKGLVPTGEGKLTIKND